MVSFLSPLGLSSLVTSVVVFSRCVSIIGTALLLLTVVVVYLSLPERSAQPRDDGALCRRLCRRRRRCVAA